MAKIDLKIYPFLYQLSGKTLDGGTHVYRPIDFCTGYGLHATADFSLLRGQISRRLQSKKLFMSRSVFLYGFCPNHLQRGVAGYRGLSPLPKQKAVSYGYSWQCVPIHPRRCQRTTRLAHLCRTGSYTYRNSSQTLQCRLVSRRPGRNGIRTRLNNYRSLPFGVPMGHFSQDKSCHQTAYFAGSAGKYPDIHSHFEWETARCQYPRCLTVGNRSLLYYGSWLSGFREALYFHQSDILFCNPCQVKYSMQETIFASGRQINRSDLRPNNHAHWGQCQEGLPRKTSSGKISRCGNQQDLSVSLKQLYFTGIDYSQVISQSLAGRAVFQMDQATSQNKKVFRNIRKCSKISNLDCGLSLCACSYHEKAAQPSRKSLHNFTDYKRLGI